VAHIAQWAEFYWGGAKQKFRGLATPIPCLAGYVPALGDPAYLGVTPEKQAG